jgi:hypothetical protein
MATRLPSNRIAWTYTDDVGQNWRMAAVKAYTDQNKLGGSAAAASVPAMPKWLKPRRIQLRYTRAGDIQRRSVVVYSVPCPILTPGSSINLNARIAGTDQSQSFANAQYPRTRLVPEGRPRKGAVVRQAS